MLFENPLVVFAASLAGLWLSAQVGAYLRRRTGKEEPNEREDLGTVLAATLTLLGLIIGFTFSMANSRYDRRKDCEAAEANAIGTEYVRVELLAAADAAGIQALLRDYLQQRISFYTSRGQTRLDQVGTATARLQGVLWAAVRSPAADQRTPTAALVAAGMNDVLNTEAYTRAAWWNRIPVAAWTLMVAIAVFGNFLLGFTAQRLQGKMHLLLILPLIVSIAFLLIADIDSPRGGLIRVSPQNLESVGSSLGF